MEVSEPVIYKGFEIRIEVSSPNYFGFELLDGTPTIIEIMNNEKIDIHNSSEDDFKKERGINLSRQEILDNLETIKKLTKHNSLKELHHTIASGYIDNGGGYDIGEMISIYIDELCENGKFNLDDMCSMYNCKSDISCFSHRSKDHKSDERRDYLCIVTRKFLNASDGMFDESKDYATEAFEYCDILNWGESWCYTLEWEYGGKSGFVGMNVETSGLLESAKAEIDDVLEFDKLLDRIFEGCYHMDVVVLNLMITYDILLSGNWSFGTGVLDILINKYKKDNSIRQYFKIDEVKKKYTKKEAEEIVRLWQMENI